MYWLNRQRELNFSPAAGLRGERWVTTLCEARNKNEARDLGFKQAQVFRLG